MWCFSNICRVRNGVERQDKRHVMPEPPAGKSLRTQRDTFLRIPCVMMRVMLTTTGTDLSLTFVLRLWKKHPSKRDSLLILHSCCCLFLPLKERNEAADRRVCIWVCICKMMMIKVHFLKQSVYHHLLLSWKRQEKRGEKMLLLILLFERSLCFSFLPMLIMMTLRRRRSRSCCLPFMLFSSRKRD